MKKNLILFISLFALIGLKFQCDKGGIGTDIVEKYSFNEKVTVSPYSLNYKIGDTLWLKLNIPEKKLFDEKTNTLVFFDSANFTAYAQLDLLYNNPFIGNGPFASFVFPSGISGHVLNSITQTSASVTFGCKPSADYDLTLGIVLIHKGIFGVSFFNNSIKKCFTDNFQNVKITYTFDVTDTHKTFYQQIPFTSIGKKQDDFVLQRLDKKTMFVINVE